MNNRTGSSINTKNCLWTAGDALHSAIQIFVQSRYNHIPSTLNAIACNTLMDTIEQSVDTLDTDTIRSIHNACCELLWVYTDLYEAEDCQYKETIGKFITRLDDTSIRLARRLLS